MLKATRLLRFFPVIIAACLALGAGPARSKDFTFDAKVNEQMARKLNIPVFFAVPARARAALPKSINTTDRLIEFKHPDANGTDVGLRLVVAKRAGLAKRLGKSGLVQTGDLLLTFRSEWGGAGAYPNIQMGISHAGIGYIKNGTLYNLDNPLSEEYLGKGMRADLTSEHYRTLTYLHIIRPRGLTDAQRANLLAWANRLNASAKRVYPSQLSFNQDYNAPKFKPGKPLDFVKQLAQIALGQDPPGNIALYCSEFVWSVLALKDCDPAKSGNVFNGKGVPACVKEPMRPMRATGNYATRKSRGSYSGLTDGPLLVVGSLKLPRDKQDAVLRSVFAESPGGLAKMSVGHRTLAQEMQPKFAPLERYYLGVSGGIWDGIRARFIGAAFSRAIPENYSPTSFLVNTLLPANNSNRTMDYVATILIE